MQKAARRIVQILRLHGHEAFFAGGWVRDFLLGRTARDIDIATSAPPWQVQSLFPHSTPVGAAFGVIQVRSHGRAYDVSTFRTEGPYLDGRHPSSVAFTGARQDALRRDFTVNGLFYDPLTGKVIDYVQGRTDLRRRVLRTIGKPEDRFREDKLRLLRAVRLACSLDFRVERATWDAVRRFAPDIATVSRERVRDELLNVLTGPNPARGLELLHESGLLRQLLPEVEALTAVPDGAGGNLLGRTREALRLLRRRSAEVGLAVLLHAVEKNAHATGGARAHTGPSKTAEEICRRLRLSNDETARVVDLVANQGLLGSLEGMRESAVKRILLGPAIEDRLELHRVASQAAGGSRQTYRFARERLRELRHSAPRPTHLITGRDLLDLGYAPGPLFGEILESVGDLALENVLRTRAEAIEHVLRNYPAAAGPKAKGKRR